MSTISYSTKYFNEGIFDKDYASIADAIISIYNPKSVAEFGCGPGYLTRELSKRNIKVFAIDGFSEPAFDDTNIQFMNVDLNSKNAIEQAFEGKFFDLAICMEVAEHLTPTSSFSLIEWLTKVANIVIFSAAVPEQGGHGHINCQTRDFWHQLFVKNNFKVQDTIRVQIRNKPNVAPWYKLNTLDYVRTDYKNPSSDSEVIANLIASESASTSELYKLSTLNNVYTTKLNYEVVKLYLKIRNIAKQIIRK